MDQTPEQLDWVKQNADKLRQRGYDPERIELDPDGNIVEIPKYGYLETLARQGVKSILPTGASLAAGAAAAPFGAPLGPLGMAGAGLVGGLLGGGAAGFAQEKALDYIAPEFQAKAAQSAAQNPKTAWLGDQATMLAAMKPNFRVLANASVLGKGALQSPAMKAAIANAAINAGGAAAGQGVNMLQGGDFEPGRFAGDVILGSVLTDPRALGRRLGLHASSDTTPLANVKDLTYEQQQMQRERSGAPADADWAKLPPIEVEVASKAEEKLAAKVRAASDKDYTKWWKSETKPTDKMFTEMMNKSKLTISPERLAELSQMPEAIAAMKSPEAFRDFVWSSSEEALQEAYAYKKRQGELLKGDEVASAEKFRDIKLAGEMARGRKTEANNRQNKNWLDAENARFEAEQAREEIESRMSRPAGSPQQPLTQAELARMTQVAAKRGLTLTFEDLGNNRGQYVLATKDGQPLLKVNPLTATIDTIAHEVGHDVFNRSASEGMQKSLMETALGSDAYKRELALRLKQGATQEQAHSIAAEEGLVHAFANAGNKTDASDVRSWFKAFKASIKHLAGSKLSPEDAIAWMHYATHNDTPWSGLRNRGTTSTMNQGDDTKPNVYYHVTTDKNALHEGKLDVPSTSTFGRKGFHVFDNESDAQFYLNGLKSWGHKQAEIVEVRIPSNEVKPDYESMGRAYYTEKLKPSYLTSDVRNQGPSLGALDPEQKKLSRVNPVVGDATAASFRTRARVIGHLESKASEAVKLNEAQKVELLKHLENENDNKTLVTPPAELAAAYAQLRNELIPEVPRMFNAEGFGIRTANGLRAHGEDPTYFMLHHMSPDVRETLTTKQGSPEYAGLRTEFIDWNTDYLRRKGMPTDKARIEAISRFDKEVTENNRKSDPSESLGFAGVRKPEGASLPPSWRSNDLMGNISNYIKRTATDFAAQKHIESSPEVMASLGAKKYGQDIDIPLDILENTPNIISNPHLQNVLRDFRGKGADDSRMADLGRVISPLALGHISRGADVMSTTGKGLVYLRPSEYYEGTKTFVDKLSNWAELKARSHESGLNRLDTGANMRHVMGVGDTNASYMTRFAALLNKAGLNQLESVARTIAQGWGETIIGIKRAQAMSGDQKSVEFLDTLSKDWRSRDDLDLSGQVGRLLQGSYDTQQLPQWMLEGPLAPYLVWSKWSMGQLQSFNDFAVAPLLKGDAKPLIGQILIGLLGGAAVNQVQEWVNNRDTRDVNWSELQAWADQNKGEFGGTGQKLLASKLLTYTQKMGTFGMAGDMAKMMTEAMAGQVPQGMLHNPTIDFIYNTAQHGAAAMSAISSGEDVGLIIKKLTKDLAVNNSQIARATRNWIDTDENLAYNDRRRQNLFNFLKGQGAGSSTFAVSYKDLDEKAFDKTKEPADMVAQAGKLLEKAATDATSQEDFVARLRKLGTSQNNIMPNPRRQPDKAFKYLKWVHDAEGADESSSTQRRWQEEDARAKYRKALVSPGSSAAR